MYPDGVREIGKVTRLAIHAVVVFVLLLCVSTLFVACPGQMVVRDASVYKAEVDFMDDASAEQVKHAIVVLREHCECEDGRWTTRACENLAETTIVMQVRMPYHVEYMRYLAGITDEQPSEDPPEIPSSETLCPEERLTDIEVPVREDLRDEDGGPDA